MTEFRDYNQYKRDTLSAIANIGRAVATIPVSRLSFAQRGRLKGKNFVTDEIWQYRIIADKLVEISYGWFMRGPALGVTVCHMYGEDSSRGAMDHKVSDCVFSISDLVEKLESLKDEGDPTSKYHEREYTLEFIGRENGAIGVTYKIRATVTAHDDESARLALYERYEHISSLYEIMPDGSNRRLACQ